tara:strand:+ start:532 stop:696 length:165 start_codon:yes stop_codon:yes gene_type:complete
MAPNVGGKEYSYTPKGMAAAKKEAKRTGKSVANKKGNGNGGSKGFNGTPTPLSR